MHTGRKCKFSNGPAAASRWATEQAGWAAADATWTHAVTAAELQAVQNQDTAQVQWTSAMAGADYTQATLDAAAAEQAIATQAQDAATAASADAVAWAAEATAVAAKTTQYDQSAIDAADQSQKSQDDQSAAFQQKLLQDYIGWEEMDASIDWSLFQGQITPDQAITQKHDAQVQYATENYNASVTFGGAVAGDFSTEVSAVSTAKVKWVTDGLTAEAAYVAAVATGTASETTSDANAWSALVTGLADDERDWETALANANLTLTTATSAVDQTLATAEAGATATDEEAYVNAAGSYETNLWSDFSATLANTATNWNATADPLGYDLALYNKSVAAALAQEVSNDSTAQEGEETQLASAEATLSETVADKAAALANSAASAAQSQTAGDSPAVASAVSSAAADQAQAAASDATAQAAYTTSAAGAVQQFESDKATADTNYDNVVAGAGASVAAGMTAYDAAYQEFLAGGISSPPVDDTQAVSKSYNEAVAGVNVTRVGKIGDAELTQATTLATAESSWSVSTGSDETTLAGQLGPLADQLAATLASDDKTFTNSLTSAATTAAEGLATAAQTFTTTSDGDIEGTQETLGTNEVTAATGIATAEAWYAYHVAEDNMNTAWSAEQANPSPANNWQYLYDQAYAGWISALALNSSPTPNPFVDNATKVAQDDADYQTALVKAAQKFDGTLGSADVTFTNADAPAAATLASSLTASDDDYSTSIVKHLDAEMITLAGADSTRTGSLAITDGNFLKGQAQADKDYQVSTAQAALNALTGAPNQFTLNGTSTVVNTPQAVYAAESADATKTLATGRADADLAWFKSQAAADSQFLQDDASSWQTDVTAQATAANTFAHADDAAAATLNDSAAGGEATVMTDQASADQTQANDDATAETGFAGAEASQTDTSWNSLATTLNGQSGGAWATFEWRKAQALDSWQTTADNNYTQYVSTLASDEVTYASADSQKFLSEAQSIDSADKTDGGGTADADKTLVNTLAGDEVGYETTAATSTATYQVAMAQAAHDNTVSLATAADTFAHDGNSTNDNNAVNAAATSLANAQSAAATQYQDGTVATTGADGIGVATATQETNDAGALLTDAQTVAGDDLTDAQTADLQIDTYSKAESDAYDLQTKNDATALDTLIKDDADALKAKAATADTGSPSSWMDQWAAATAADDTKEDADADAALSATNSTADALDIKEKNEADAQQKKDDGDAQAIHDKAVNDAQATHDQSISDAGNITAAVAKDAYFATLPDVYPAFTWDPTVNPALLDASYDEVYAVDDLALPLSAGQDDGSSPLPPGDVIGNAVNGIPSPAPSPQSPVPLLGQSFSLGATTDPYSGIATTATPMVTTLLNDNGVYDPGNPYSSFTGWPGSPFLTGETMPLPGGQSGNYTFMPTAAPQGAPPPGGGGGQGGQPNPSPPPGQQAPLVPPTDPRAAELSSNAQEGNGARPANRDWLKEQQAAERGMTLEEFDAENERAWMENRKALQSNATSLKAEADLNKNGLFGSARKFAEEARSPASKLGMGMIPSPGTTPDIAASAVMAMDIVDRVAKNWRQNRTAGAGVVESALVVGGTQAADLSGVTGVSNFGARHEAVNAEREQTLAERVIQGVTGVAQLISTGFGILGVGTAIGTKAGLITPKIPGPAPLNPGVIEAELAEPAILAERAAQYHSALDPIAQNHRTTAALGTDGGTIIGGGVRDLSPAQRALQKEGEILAKLPGEHAEVTVLQEAAKRGLRPSALESTRDFCSGCMQALIDAGATITGSRSAVWFWRK